MQHARSRSSSDSARSLHPGGQVKLLEIQSSPRGDSSDSIALTTSFIEACKSANASMSDGVMILREVLVSVGGGNGGRSAPRGFNSNRIRCVMANGFGSFTNRNS